MKKLARYEILAEIAEGGMAVVYAARPEDDPSQLLALKVIRPQHATDDTFVKMFIDEARISSRLVHPNIIRTHELARDGKYHFLAMELVLGQTLARIEDTARERGIPIPHEIAAFIGARLAEGLHYAHDLEDRNIVHRDVNPANVIVTYDGRPKLIDFGLARAVDRIASTTHGVVKGKLAYLSPEQAQGKKVDRRADVFALGITLWELTTGQRLFKAESDVATVKRVLTSEAPDPTTIVPGYPPELANAVMRALARDLDKRWQSARELQTALDAYVANRVDEKTVARFIAKVFPADRKRQPWEEAIESVARTAARRDGFLAWDDDEKKMTWFQLEGGTREFVGFDPAALDALLARRAESDDVVTAARARMEQAIVAELAGDPKGAEKHARAALEADRSTTAAHWILRRVRHDREKPKRTLEHLAAEIAAATTEEARADLLAERARTMAAAGEPAAAVRDEYERALSLRANHAAALAGLEDACEGVGLAKHLARLATAVDADPKLAAWLHVERSRLLDAASETAAAADAMRAALSLDTGLGPVRDACVRRAVVQRDSRTLVALLDSEALLEKDPARAAALECDAACIARLASNDGPRALALLGRAAARGVGGALARRIADALVEIAEEKQDWAGARTARHARAKLHATAAERANELRASAVLAERAGDAKSALADLEAAHAVDPADARTTAELDRLLADPEKREALWATHASRCADGSARTRAWVRAADLAQANQRTAQSVAYLRDALAATPDDPDVIERLAAALPGARESAADVHARAAVYERAAELAEDPVTRVAWLERIALVHEEIAGDLAAARRVWAAVLTLEPERRSALLGLQRVAARAGDAAALASALLDEAKVSKKRRAAQLRLRAARALASTDPDRAIALCGDGAGLSLATELHARAGRWAEAATAIEARIADADDPAKAALLVELAEIQRSRLGSPDAALASLRSARKLAPDLALADDVVALAAQRTDPKLLREVFDELSQSAKTASERVRFAVRAAELDELVLGDDARAAEAYARAIETVPDDPWLAARLDRVRARLAPDDAPRTFEDALVALERGNTDAARGPIDALIAADPKSIPALRALAALATRTSSAPLLANTLEAQIGAFQGDRARLVALWKEAYLVEWRLPESGATDVYERILALGADRAALDAVARRALATAREDDKARDASLRALEGLLVFAPDVSSRLAIMLHAAALHDARGDRAGALAQYKHALAVDARSPTAAMQAARLAELLRDNGAMVDASCALAELASDGVARAALFVRAGGTLAAQPDDASRARAADLLERALEADPASAPAAGSLVVLLQDRDKRRLVSALRAALDKTKQPEAVLLLATEIARIARGDADDLPLVVSALERARDVMPTHAPTWLALAEVSAAQKAWPEAIAAYEAAAEHSRDLSARKRALAALGQLHRTLGNGPAELAVIRRICDLDPKDTAAHRALVDALRALPFDEKTRAEIGQRLERLAAAEATPEARAQAWLDLAALRKGLGDRVGSEQALARGVAESPTAENLARIAAAYGSPPQGPRDHARVLELVLARASEVGRPSGTAFGALAALEIDALGRAKEGVAHARAAIALAPKEFEARAALVRGLAQLGEHAEAVSIALPMFESPEAVASLAKLDSFMDVLETSLHAAGRRQEALVARELRALGGAVGDAALVSLRARRLPDVRDGGPPVLSRATVWQRVLPAPGRSLALEIAGAVASAIGPFFPSEVEGITRGNVSAGHPLLAPFRRVTSTLGLEGAELAVSDAVYVPRASATSVPLVIAPSALAKAPEPLRVAALARAATRLLLGAPWVDRARVDRARAVLVAAARVVTPSFATSPQDRALEQLVAEYTKPVSKALGRGHKKALSALEPRLEQSGATLTADDVSTLVRRVGQTELAVAFVLTGDLVATLDDLRASDGDYARAVQNPSTAALVATLRHPLAGEAVRFALGETATELRRSAGSLWNS